MNAKQIREIEVFRGFVAASCLPVDDSSILGQGPPRPDIRCVFTAQGERLFELAEVLWEDLDPDAATAGLAHGLALSERASRRKAALVAAGREEEAQSIQTWGGYRYPCLTSLIRVLEKKCARRYQTDGLPVHLLLYYARQNPLEPFKRLVDQYHPMIKELLGSSPFSDVWLYHHEVGYTIRLGGPQAASGFFSVPLAAFARPESRRRLIGHIAGTGSDPVVILDESYSRAFYEASDALAEALGRSRTESADRAADQ
jgi:hypothetical protein